MTRKEQILRMIGKLDDDVSYERVIYHLSVMQGIEIGLAEAERGEGIDHTLLFDRLLAKYGENQDTMDAARSSASATPLKSHRTRSPKGRSKIHSSPQKLSRKT